MKERVGDEKLIIINVGLAVRGINGHIREEKPGREAIFIPVTGYVPFGNYGLVVCLTVVCISKMLSA